MCYRVTAVAVWLQLRTLALCWVCGQATALRGWAHSRNPHSGCVTLGSSLNRSWLQFPLQISREVTCSRGPTHCTPSSPVGSHVFAGSFTLAPSPTPLLAPISSLLHTAA